jgi:hypothetical protein
MEKAIALSDSAGLRVYPSLVVQLAHEICVVFVACCLF